MTVNELLAKLVREGCLISVQGLYFHPAVADIREEELRWINAYPSSQHDAHWLPFHKAEVVHDRDLAFYGLSGALVGYIAPFAEWENEWSETAKMEKARWEEHLRNPENAELFNQFKEAEWT